jgi:hypothetical protein
MTDIPWPWVGLEAVKDLPFAVFVADSLELINRSGRESSVEVHEVS